MLRVRNILVSLILLTGCQVGINNAAFTTGEVCVLDQTIRRGNTLVVCYSVDGKEYKTSCMVGDLYVNNAIEGTPFIVKYDSTSPSTSYPAFKQVEWSGEDSMTSRLAKIEEVDSFETYSLSLGERIVHYEIVYSYSVNDETYMGATITEDLNGIEKGDEFYLFLYKNRPKAGVIRLDIPFDVDDIIRQLDSLSKQH